MQLCPGNYERLQEYEHFSLFKVPIKTQALYKQRNNQQALKISVRGNLYF